MTFNGWKEVVLEEVSYYGEEKIPSAEVTLDNYISTENMLPNKSGVGMASGLPTTKSVRRYKKGDILLSNIRPYFKKIWFATKNGGCSNDVLVIKNKDEKELDKKYLYYTLLQDNFFDYVTATSKGTKMPRGDKSAIMNYGIMLPPLNEQKAIANILSTLDEKIETNNQINEKLEEMAQALFKHWFVDFEFPNENGEPYKSSGGEMVESELGMIPKGWEVGKLGDIISISSGKRPKEKQADSSEKYPFPIVGASSIMGYTSDFNYNEPVLIIGRVGTHGIIQRFTNKVWASDNTLVIKSKYYGFTYNILKSIDYKSLNRGSTQPLITQKDIKNTTVLIPPSNVVNSYEDFYSSLFEKYRTNKVESDLLTKIRDSILPKLMSGEIRVPLDNEELVEQS